MAESEAVKSEPVSCVWPVSATLKPSHPNGASKLPRLSPRQSSCWWRKSNKQKLLFLFFFCFFFFSFSCFYLAGSQTRQTAVCPSSWEALWFTIKITLRLHSSQGTFTHTLSWRSPWSTALGHIAAVLWKIKGKCDSEHVDLSEGKTHRESVENGNERERERGFWW